MAADLLADILTAGAEHLRTCLSLVAFRMTHMRARRTLSVKPELLTPQRLLDRDTYGTLSWSWAVSPLISSCAEHITEPWMLQILATLSEDGATC